jgi:hypothetical protein
MFANSALLLYSRIAPHRALSLWSLVELFHFFVRLTPAEMTNKVAYEKMEIALRPYDLAPFVPGVMLMLCVLGCLLCFAMIMLC